MLDTGGATIGSTGNKAQGIITELTGRFAQCRSSGMALKALREAQGVSNKKYYYWERQVVAKDRGQADMPITSQPGMLMRVNLAVLPEGNLNAT